MKFPASALLCLATWLVLLDDVTLAQNLRWSSTTATTDDDDASSSDAFANEDAVFWETFVENNLDSMPTPSSEDPPPPPQGAPPVAPPTPAVPAPPPPPSDCDPAGEFCNVIIGFSPPCCPGLSCQVTGFTSFGPFQQCVPI